MEYIKIGNIQRPHGIDGEFKIAVEDKFIDDLLECDAVFLDIKGTKVPYFIEELREGAMLILKLEDVGSRTEAEAIGKKELYLRRSDISLTQDEIDQPDHLQFGHLLRYTIVEQTLGEVGIIGDILEFPQQEMAEIQRDERTILVPLLPNWIVRVDKDAKKVYMELPEGLLDL